MSGAPRTAGRASLGPGVVPPAPSTSNKLLSRAESNWGKVRDVAKTNVKDSGTSVRVVCRVRPMNRKELDMKTTPCVVAKGGTSVVVSEGDANFSDKRRFNFDKVYGSESKQGEVFDFCWVTMPNGLVLQGMAASGPQLGFKRAPLSTM